MLLLLIVLRQNVVFNGPRAGLLINDGMYGNHTVEKNILFNLGNAIRACYHLTSLVRSSTDHGPFNSWDRTPFVTEGDEPHSIQVGPRLNHIRRNLILCTVQ